jgi:hypothetical protein
MSASVPSTRIKTNRHVFVLEDEVPGAPGLRAVRCRACRCHTLGRALICSHCFSRDVAPEAAGQRAELVEFAVSNHPAGGFSAPYAIGLICTEEGFALFAPLVGDPASFAHETLLRFTLLDRDDGTVAFAYAADDGAQ